MRIRLAFALKVLASALGVAAFVMLNVLYIQYAQDGAVSAGGEFQVVLNNHGSIRYISREQDWILTWLGYSCFGLFGLALVAEVLEQRWRRGNAHKH